MTKREAVDIVFRRYAVLESLRDDIRKHAEVTAQIGPANLCNLFDDWFSRLDKALQDLKFEDQL